MLHFAVKLKDITHDILQKVVELFYMRELLVSEQLKPKIIEALTLLKTYDIGVLGKRFRKKLTNGKCLDIFFIEGN